MIAPVTPEEEKLYGEVDFDLNDYCQDVGVCKLVSGEKKTILMVRYSYTI